MLNFQEKSNTELAVLLTSQAATVRGSVYAAETLNSGLPTDERTQYAAANLSNNFEEFAALANELRNRLEKTGA